MSWNQPRWNQAEVTSPQVADVRDERVGAFLSRVYGWMFFGLLVTAVVAFAVVKMASYIEISNPAIF